MNRLRGLFAVVAVLGPLLASAGAPVRAADINLNFYPISSRTLDDEPWGRLYNQVAEMCATVDFGGPSWPIHLALGLHQSFDEFEDLDAGVGEMSVGIARVWAFRAHRVRPFIGAGASYVAVELERYGTFGQEDDEDSGVGYYAEGGLYWRLGPHFNLGFYGRVLTSADLELFGGDATANYVQYGPLLGWSWPARRPEPLPGVM